MLFLLYFMIAMLSGDAKAAAQRPGERVYGGDLPPLDYSLKHTFTALIVVEDADIFLIACTGNIISTVALITTAECVYFPDATALNVVVTITGNDGNNHETTSSNFVTHESYNPDTSENNIAVLIVDIPFPETPAYAPVNEPPVDWVIDQFPGESLTVAGYRNPYTILDKYLTEPTYGTFIQRSRHYCSGIFKDNYKMQRYEFCASSDDMESLAVCGADFGAGLIYYNEDEEEHYIYGLASRPHPVDCIGAPTVFIFVLDYIQWIHDTISNIT